MIKTKLCNIRTIQQDHPQFLLRSGNTICPRAGFQISDSCPPEYDTIIRQALLNGWIKPVAHVYGQELTMDLLR
jgi:hypothetical protein